MRKLVVEEIWKGDVMIHKTSALLFTMTFMLVCGRGSVLQATGAGIECEILYNEAMELYRIGRYNRATAVAQHALRVAEQNVGCNHPDVGTTLNMLAMLYRTLGDYAKAEPLHKRALAIGEKTLAPDHPSVGTYLSNLAGLYAVQGEYAKAEPLYKRALAVTEKTLGLDHLDVETIQYKLRLIRDVFKL